MKSMNSSNSVAKSFSQRFTEVAVLAVALAAIPAVQAKTYVLADSINFGLTGTYFVDSPLDSVAIAATRGLIVAAPGPIGAGQDAQQQANITQVSGYIDRAYAGSLWTGTGITSAAAQNDANVNGVLGVMFYDNNQFNYTAWQGLTGLDTLHGTNFDQVMVRVTYLGDYNGDGVINSLDYAVLNSYVGSGLTAQGDINGDGLLNSLDYSTLNAVAGSGPVYGNLSDATLPFAAVGKTGLVPEPASGALLLSGAAWLLSLRKRKQVN